MFIILGSFLVVVALGQAWRAMSQGELQHFEVGLNPFGAMFVLGPSWGYGAI